VRLAADIRSVINGGDGVTTPTQTLCDIFTLKRTTSI
jgi:aspartate carbamoyltransferase catalytic subunit